MRKVRLIVAIVIGVAVAFVANYAIRANRDTNITAPPPARPSADSTFSAVEPVADPTAPTVVYGQVINFTTNEPVPDMNVEARPKSGSVCVAKTDASGRFTITIEPQKEYTLAPLVSEGWGVEAKPTFTARSGEQLRDDRFILRIAHANLSISGSVVERSVRYGPTLAVQVRNARSETEINEMLVPTASPLANVVVELSSAADLRHTTTDSRGYFTFDGITPGGYVVRAIPPEEKDIPLTMDNVPAQDVYLDPGINKTDVELAFDFGMLNISGRVVDSRGLPVANAVITAVRQRSDGAETTNNEVILDTKSSHDGEFQIRGARLETAHGAMQYMLGGRSPTPYVLTAKHDGYSTESVVVPAINHDLAEVAKAMAESLARTAEEQFPPLSFEPPTRTDTVSGIKIVLRQPAQIGGVLKTRTEAPVPIRDLVLNRIAPSSQPALASYSAIQTVETRTDRESKFRFENVPPGKYEMLTREKGTLLPVQMDPILINEGDRITGLRIYIDHLVTLGTIRASVQDDTGQALSNFAVRVVDLHSDTNDVSDMSYGNVVLGSAGSGLFEIKGVTPGLASVEVSATGFAPQIRTLEVRAGQITSADFALTKESVLEVFTLVNGSPVTDPYLLVYQEKPNGETHGLNPQSDLNEERHSRILRGLGEGDYLVIARRDTNDGGNATRFEAARVRVERGSNATLSLELGGSAGISVQLRSQEPHVRGNVLIFEGERPAATADLSLIYKHENLRAGAWRVAVPEFEIMDLPPGEYYLGAGNCRKRELTNFDNTLAKSYVNRRPMDASGSEYPLIETNPKSLFETRATGVVVSPFVQSYRVFDEYLFVMSEVPEMSEHIDTYMRNLRVGISKADVRLALFSVPSNGGPKAVQACSPELDLAQTDTLGFRSWMRFKLLFTQMLREGARKTHLMHASAVVNSSGIATLFVGPSGSGKTTLLIELLRKGFRMACDDFAPVTLDEAKLVSLPTGVTLCERSLNDFPEFRPGVRPSCRFTDQIGTRECTLNLSDYFEACTAYDEFVIGNIFFVFPDFGGASKVEICDESWGQWWFQANRIVLQGMSPNLLSSTVNHHELCFTVCRRILRNVNVYRLTNGSINQTVDLVLERVIR